MKQSIILALASLVIASQACAQTASSPWADRLREVSDVGTIGATFDARQANVICDGSTDGEAPLNALLTRAGEAARGGSARSLVYLPPAARPCILSRPLTVPSNVILFAEPATVTLKPSISATAEVLILALNSAHNVLVYGISFDGGARDPVPVQSSARLALVYVSQNVISDRVAFRHSRGIGLEWSNASDSGVRNSEFVDIGNYWQQSGRREDRLVAMFLTFPQSQLNPEVIQQAPQVAFLAKSEMVGEGLDPDRASTVEAITSSSELAPSKLLMNFESLGENCEFGFAQRFHGCEPLGLLGFSSMPHHLLMPALENRFDGVGDTENTILEAHPETKEFFLSDSRYDMTAHTFTYENAIDRQKFFQQQCRRLTYLRRKLITDLENCEKILVYRSIEFLSDEQIWALFRKIESYGPNTLLCVRLQSDGTRDGRVEKLAERL
jgi:hypothetical protein